MPTGDDWIFGGATPQTNADVAREAGTADEGMFTGFAARNADYFGGGTGYIDQATANQARGLNQPMQNLLQQSNPLIDQLRLQGGRRLAQNPYSTAVADQTRAAQMALIQQMRGQMNGPSLANMQGQRALGQSGQQALGAAAMGAPGRAAMLQAQQVGGGLAGDVGQARLAEVMRSQGGMGGAAGRLRGGSLESASNQMQAGLRAQSLADENARFSATQGSALSDANRNAALEYYKLVQRLRQKNAEKVQKTGEDTVNAVKTAISTGMGV